MTGNMIRLWAFVLAIVGVAGCTPAHYRQRIDKAAYKIIEQKQKEALGHTEAFTVESPADTLRRRLLLDQHLPISHPASLGTRSLEPIAHWPEKHDVVSDQPDNGPRPDANDQVLTITLIQALQIAARNSREYQSAKEDVFRNALDLDLESNTYRTLFSGGGDYTYTHDRTKVDSDGKGVSEGTVASIFGGASRRFLNGAAISTQLGWNLINLLQPAHNTSNATFGDASISIPLLRGSDSYIAGESLTQSERDVLYALWTFETYKKQFAVNVTDSYLSALQSADQVRNQEQNYRGLITSTRRALRLAEAGKLPQIQVDQAISNELRSRNRWVSTQQALIRAHDNFKILLGLPTDARIALDRNELQHLHDYFEKGMNGLFVEPPAPEGKPADTPFELIPPDPKEAGPYEMKPEDAIRLALDNRLDLRTRQGRVLDAQRQVVVQADALRAQLDLLGSAHLGEHRSLSSADKDDLHRLDFNRGSYQALLSLDLPLERTREAIAYRDSYITLEQRVRDLQGQEDQIKQQVRNTLRSLLEQRESLKIQFQSVKVAERRVSGSALQLEAGRAQMRDLLDAQDALVNAQNALTQAMVTYRVAELGLQRDLGLLQVDPEGLWHEFNPKEVAHDSDAK